MPLTSATAGTLASGGPLLLAALAGAVAAVLLIWAVRLVMGRAGSLARPADRATFETLHTASLAAPSLRAGLTPSGAKPAVRPLRALLGTEALALTDVDRTLAWDGAGDQHSASAVGWAATVLGSGRPAVLGPREVACQDPTCPVRYAVIAPVTSEDKVVGALVACTTTTSAGLLRATGEVARWVSAQVELAELDASRTRAIEAELRALRAQISPHFVYNSLAAIASFVRTDPTRARELLLEFADFTRYAFRRSGDFTTLADELKNVERYLVLEQARFGDRLQVSLLVAPEVLPVALPFLSVQPLVENAVRHGLEDGSGTGQVALVARDDGSHAVISVEDDGAGSDPEVVRRVLAGDQLAGSVGGSVGLGNVDARLRQLLGDDCGLVVETAVGAGTKVTFRVPKFAPGVHADGRSA